MKEMLKVSKYHYEDRAEHLPAKHFQMFDHIFFIRVEPKIFTSICAKF